MNLNQHSAVVLNNGCYFEIFLWREKVSPLQLEMCKWSYT